MIERIALHFNSKTCKRFQSNSSNEVYLVKSSTEYKILKIYKNKTKWLTEKYALSLNYPNDIIVPSLITSAQVENCYCNILSYIPWKRLSQHQVLSSKVAHKLGETLACLHGMSKKDKFGIPNIAEHSFNNYKDYLQKEIARQKKVLTKFNRTLYIENHVDELEQLLHEANEFPCVPTHRDFFSKNILYSTAGSDLRLSIIDFEHFFMGIPEFDFVKLYVKDFRLDYKAAEDFWDAYMLKSTDFSVDYIRIKISFLLQSISMLRYGFEHCDPVSVKESYELSRFIISHSFEEHFKRVCAKHKELHT